MTLMSTNASASAAIPAPIPLAEGCWLVATGVSGPAAGVPGRLKTSLTAAAASPAPAAGPERDNKCGIAWLASTAKACVAVRLTDVRLQRFRRVFELVHVTLMILQRLTRPTSWQRAVPFTHVFVPLRVVQVVAFATHRFTRLVTLQVSGLGLGLRGGVMTGVPPACAAFTAGDGADAASADAEVHTIARRSASASAATTVRRRERGVIAVSGIVCVTPPRSAGYGAHNTSAMHG